MPPHDRTGRWSMRDRVAAGVMVAAVFVAARQADGQSLASRIESAGDGSVQFHFASRAGVCGNGRTWFRVDDDGWYQSSGSWGSVGDGGRADQCERGPVRVVVTRAGRETVRVEAYAGPLAAPPEDGRDLGVTSTRDAVQYLLSLAATADGRAAREALTPALLADSAIVTPQLLALAKDRNRSRDVRRSAVTWLARRRAESGGPGATAVVTALHDMVRDRTESEALRQHALSTVASLGRGEGIPALIGFAADGDPWVARQATATLARSGDPRARAFARAAVRRSDLPDEARSEVIRGIGGEYATAGDYRLLREVYSTLNADRDRDAVISTLAAAGGSENTQWLLDLAKSPTEPVARRRRVITALGRLDDPRIKDALKGLLER